MMPNIWFTIAFCFVEMRIVAQHLLHITSIPRFRVQGQTLKVVFYPVHGCVHLPLVFIMVWFACCHA